MNWIDKLERKFGKCGIQNLPIYIAVAYGIGFLLNLLAPSFYSTYLALDVGMILKGQIWRIITFVIDPPSSSIIFIIFAIYLYYFIGTSLVNSWGAFRFTLYYFSGVLFHVIGAFIIYLITYLVYGVGISVHFGSSYLNLSMFFAFAALFPDVKLLLFFIIPIKIKWLAYVDGAFFLYSIIRGLIGGGVLGYSVAFAAIISLLNFLIFFLSSRNIKQKVQTKQRQIEYAKKEKHYQEIQYARDQAAGRVDGAHHSCYICKRTEITNPELDFRYCSKCKGAHEYCSDHLFTHPHIQ